MTLIRLFVCFALASSLVYYGNAQAAPDRTPSVVVSIKPLHSLVAGVMRGVGTPHLLLTGTASPHHFQLKPSQAVLLSRADLVVWVGPNLETPLQKSLASLSKTGVSLALMDVSTLKILKSRSPHHHGTDHHGKHEEHGKHDDHGDHKEHGKHDDHGDHKDHAKHDDHGDHKDHAKHDDHEDHKDHAKHDDHEEHAADDHGEGLNDPHIWLTAQNAIAITKAVSLKLSSLYPDHASHFQSNALDQIQRLEELDDALKQQLSGLSSIGFMVFHDAYNYLTSPFGFKYEGAIHINPAVSPSAKHLKKLRDRLKENNVSCVFAEPQYSQKLLRTLVEGTKTKIALLDPIGIDIPAGPKAYEKMMRRLGDNLASCLKP